MSDQQFSPGSDQMQRFSATGRPHQAPNTADKHANTYNSFSNAESFGAGPANLLPHRYDDDSLIPVPVMRPEDIGKVEGHKKEKKSFFSSRRKAENSKFTMKDIPRGEYLKHYAKDDAGKYIGTEEPAEDCILRGEDVDRYRGKLQLQYKNEMDSAAKAEAEDGVVR